MRVLMLGWEFPPFISGGLGTACYGLTRALDHLGTTVYFVLPRPFQVTEQRTHVRLVAPSPQSVAKARAAEAAAAATSEFQMREFAHARFRAVDAAIQPYQSPDAGKGSVLDVSIQREWVPGTPLPAVPAPATAGVAPPMDVRVTQAASLSPPAEREIYGGDLFAEVERYARLACLVAQEQQFDVIHAHDWMTYAAGLAVRGLTRKPLVIHVHSTEFDRSGLHVNQRVYDLERAGMHGADAIIAVSHLTKNIVSHRYGVDPRRVTVVYNGIDEKGERLPALPPISRDEKIVLFLGRITMQKGPEYFLAAARRVLEVVENVRFIMAGSGDMIRRTIEMAAEMGIGHRVLFTGFLRGDDVKRVYRMADLYVMPSVSEPFGIAPLEAISNDVPVLISKQSGVAEVLSHALKVDFWDIDEMANKIVAVLRHPPLQATLRDHGKIEVKSLSWTDAAQDCIDVYRRVAGRN